MSIWSTLRTWLTGNGTGEPSRQRRAVEALEAAAHEDAVAKDRDEIGFDVQRLLNEVGALSTASGDAIARFAQPDRTGDISDFNLASLAGATLDYWARVVKSSASVTEMSASIVSRELHNARLTEATKVDAGTSEPSDPLSLVQSIAKANVTFVEGMLDRSDRGFATAQIDDITIAMWDYYRELTRVGVRAATAQKNRAGRALLQAHNSASPIPWWVESLSAYATQDGRRES